MNLAFLILGGALVFLFFTRARMAAPAEPAPMSNGVPVGGNGNDGVARERPRFIGPAVCIESLCPDGSVRDPITCGCPPITGTNEAAICSCCGETIPCPSVLDEGIAVAIACVCAAPENTLVTRTAVFNADLIGDGSATPVNDGVEVLL